MSIVSAATSIVNKTVVSGVASLVLNSIKSIYAMLPNYTSRQELQEKLDSIFIKTDMEVIGAFLSDMDEKKNSTCERVCLEHMHCTLKELNTALTDLDTCLRSLKRFLTSYSSILSLVSVIERKKSDLDHQFERLLQVSLATKRCS